MYDFKITDEPFAVGYVNADSDSIYISTGMGYVNALKNVNIHFNGETGFPELDFGAMACTTHFAQGQACNFGLLDAKAKENPQFAEDYRIIEERMHQVDVGHHMWSAFSKNEMDVLFSHSGWGGTWGGHAVPDLFAFATLGTEAMRKRVRRAAENNPLKEDFYQGLLLTLDAVDILGERICNAARDEYEKTKDQKVKRTGDAFEYCPRTPAKSFEHAVCVYATLCSLDGIDSPGHFDLYMIELWESSPYAQSRCALEDLWIYFHQTRTWNLCISGSDKDWNDTSNALTYEILEVTRKYRFETPNLTLRCHRNTPEKLWKEIYKTLAAGTGMPVLYNDEVVCPALESFGISREHSHLYVMNGCNQIDIQGISHMGLEDGEVNLGLCLSYALLSGYNVMQDKQVGKATESPCQLDTFDAFYNCLKEQITYVTNCVCSMSNKSQKARALYSSNPLRSLTIEGCIEKGLDYKNKGPVYGNGQILFEGVPDCIDSLANIKKFVYEDKKYTLSQVSDAIRNDFEGYEEMLLTFKNSGLNFGNDIPYVDSLGAQLIDFCNTYLQTQKTFRGGIYTGGCSPFDRAAENGNATGALPNGKRKGEHIFGDSIGATPGKDVNGPTALLNSCLCFDHKLAGSGFILNLKFDKRLFSSTEGEAAFLSLAKTYFDRGGQQLSVTVVSRDELTDAMVNPDAHKNLIVRVGGFSAYFVELDRDLQENILARTDY